MITLLILVIAILSGVVYYQRNRLRRTRADLATVSRLEMDSFNKLMEVQIKNFDLEHQLITANEAYRALDKGAQEIQEGYEQEYLTKNETIEVLRKNNEKLGLVFRYHYEHCLPDVLDMPMFEGFDPDLYEETPLFDAIVLKTDNRVGFYT